MRHSEPTIFASKTVKPRCSSSLLKPDLSVWLFNFARENKIESFKEKDILIQNRIRLNNEFEEQRLKKYSEYLDREAEVLRIQKNTERDQFNAKMAEHQRSKFIRFRFE